MKSRGFTFLLIIVINIVLTGSIFSWGNRGHKLIAAKAFECLPKEMAFMLQYKPDIVEHSTDPDTRKKNDKSESPKHFIDIDYYPEFQQGQMILSMDSLVAKYGFKVVKKQGILPWATETTLDSLTMAFREKNADKIRLFAADLAHYVADGYQPMHATVNYDGQLTGQKGLHSRYEINMIDNNLETLDKDVQPEGAFLVTDPERYIFSYICGSDIYNDLILSADKFARKASTDEYNGDYYRLLWFRTRFLTENQMSDAARAIASFYYTAWVNAGSPVLSVTN